MDFTALKEIGHTKAQDPVKTHIKHHMACVVFLVYRYQRFQPNLRTDAESVLPINFIKIHVSITMNAKTTRLAPIREFSFHNTMCLHVNLHQPRILRFIVQIFNIEQPLGFYAGVFYSQ